MEQVLLIAGILAVSIVAYADNSVPEVTVDYSPFFDSICDLIKNYEIKDEWKKELEKKR